MITGRKNTEKNDTKTKYILFIFKLKERNVSDDESALSVSEAQNVSFIIITQRERAATAARCVIHVM